MSMIRTLMAAAVAVSILSSGAEAAQDVGTAPAASCELHVWPASGLRSVYYGWFHGGINDGAVTGRQGYPQIPRDPLPAATQIELMKTADVAKALHLDGYLTVWHDAPLDSTTIRQATGRLSDSHAACYAELVGDDIFFQQDVFNGGFLKSLNRFRSFDGDTVTRTFGTWTSTKLMQFPPKVEANNEAALAELKSAYSANLDLFGEFLNKPQKKKKKS